MASVCVCVCCVSDDLEALSVRQFIKHVMEFYSNNQQGFSQEFNVSMNLSECNCVHAHRSYS